MRNLKVGSYLCKGEEKYKMRKQVVIFIFILCLVGCVKETQDIAKEKEKFVDVGGKRVLMIIASSNFRDEEYLIPRKIFNAQSIEVITAASSLKISRGMLGAEVKPDIVLNKVKVEDYDAIIFVGGTGASQYWNDKTAHYIAQKSVSEDKILAAICIAPVTLANAEVLKGKRATVFFTEAGRLKEKGANYTAQNVEIDGNIITANGPLSSEKFAQIIIKALHQKMLPQ